MTYSGKAAAIKTTRIIEYKCGCTITLSHYGLTEAPRCCEKHFLPVTKITTIEEMLE